MVDDSRVMRRLLRNTLIAAGYEGADFMEAADGKDALEKLSEIEYEVDIVFCDLCMPRMDGLSFVETLAAQGRAKTVPIIICTGDLREARGREALIRGARKLISKPFTAEKLTDVVRDILDERVKKV